MDSIALVDKDGYLESHIEVADRKFSIRVIQFDNGAFVSIFEGAPRIGSTVVSVNTSDVPATTTVIPTKTDSMFLKLAAEMISSRTRGIAMVSLSVKSEIPSTITRTILLKIMDMI